MPSYIRKDKTITVMDVKGKNLEVAIKQLGSEGFKGTVFDTVYTSELNPSTIVDQYPSPGKKVKHGRTIRLKISHSEKMIEVPSLVGQSRRSAKIAIQQLGLLIDSVYLEPGPPNEDTIELSRVSDRGIRESGMIDTSQLVIKEGEKVFSVFIDIAVINEDGNLFDAVSYAIATALSLCTMPKFKIEVV